MPRKRSSSAGAAAGEASMGGRSPLRRRKELSKPSGSPTDTTRPLLLPAPCKCGGRGGCSEGAARQLPRSRDAAPGEFWARGSRPGSVPGSAAASHRAAPACPRPRSPASLLQPCAGLKVPSHPTIPSLPFFPSLSLFSALGTSVAAEKLPDYCLS